MQDHKRWVDDCNEYVNFFGMRTLSQAIDLEWQEMISEACGSHRKNEANNSVAYDLQKARKYLAECENWTNLVRKFFGKKALIQALHMEREAMHEVIRIQEKRLPSQDQSKG